MGFTVLLKAFKWVLCVVKGLGIERKYGSTRAL